MSVTEKSDCFLEANIDTLEGETKDIPELAERFARRRNSQAVRWYVLTLPVCHRGPAPGLRQEQERRLRSGEPPFEFFAPSYVEVRHENGRPVNTRRPLRDISSVPAVRCFTTMFLSARRKARYIG